MTTIRLKEYQMDGIRHIEKSLTAVMRQKDLQRNYPEDEALAEVWICRQSFAIYEQGEAVYVWRPSQSHRKTMYRKLYADALCARKVRDDCRYIIQEKALVTYFRRFV